MAFDLGRRGSWASVCCAALVSILAFATPATAQQAKPAPAPTATKQNVSLDQARLLAYQALRQGRIDFAIKVAKGLLQADPHDPSAHFILASAMARAGDAASARKSAATAFRKSTDPQQRVAAAEFAARAALVEERPTLTQLWLRRAAIHAKDETSQLRIAQNYRRVRQINPFSFRLGFGFRPSNNVNNGADSALQVIDGVPAVGVLSGSAQALAGNIGLFNLNLRYRLRQTERSELSVSSQSFVRRVWLSSGARAQAPDLENEDLGSTYIANFVTQRFALGAPGNTASVGFGFGRAWSGGDERFDFLALRGSRSVQLGDKTRLSVHASVEDRRSAVHDVFDEDLIKIGTTLQYAHANGDVMGVSLGLTETISDFSNAASSSQTLRASYSFGKALGPANVSTSLTIGQAAFDEYRVGFINVPNGRQDNSIYADVTFFFSDWDYAGFAPSLRVRTGRRDSNVSRFESDEFSVDFQIRSSF